MNNTPNVPDTAEHVHTFDAGDACPVAIACSGEPVSVLTEAVAIGGGSVVACSDCAQLIKETIAQMGKYQDGVWFERVNGMAHFTCQEHVSAGPAEQCGEQWSADFAGIRPTEIDVCSACVESHTEVLRALGITVHVRYEQAGF